MSKKRKSYSPEFKFQFVMEGLRGEKPIAQHCREHDVQRASRGAGEGKSIFGINSTFKTNHFLGYTVALNRLDGVYYVDPRPEMKTNQRLKEQINDFQHFITHDLWRLSH